MYGVTNKQLLQNIRVSLVEWRQVAREYQRGGLQAEYNRARQAMDSLDELQKRLAPIQATLPLEVADKPIDSELVVIRRDDGLHFWSLAKGRKERNGKK